jgi:alkylated DNA repair dioxygenase AlkB
MESCTRRNRNGLAPEVLLHMPCSRKSHVDPGFNSLRLAKIRDSRSIQTPISDMRQQILFDDAVSLPSGARYETNFISAEEAQSVLREIRGLPLEEAIYKEYRARRRVAYFGSSYDFGRNERTPADPVPDFIKPLRAKVARWSGVAPEDFRQVLVSEYQPGTPLGWHRDTPDYELIAGISLQGVARMRFRPWPHRVGEKHSTFDLTLQPRSVYCLAGEARWGWQHSVPPVKELRYSITFRTLRQASAIKPSQSDPTESQ